MTQEMNELITIFNNVKKKGWIRSINKGKSSVGLTFEREIGKPIDQLPEPDFKNIEIKCFKDHSIYLRSLFSATPNGSSSTEILRLRDKFGYPCKGFENIKSFCGDVSAVKKQFIGCKYLFQLNVSYEQQKVILQVFTRNNILIDTKTYWTFDILKEKVFRKLKYLALVEAISKYENYLVYFKYTHMIIYQFKSFDDFLNAIENGIISVTFNISIFKSGNRKGLIHDHGTEFRIHHKNLSEIYEKIVEV